jgi:hypothetical protein
MAGNLVNLGPWSEMHDIVKPDLFDAHTEVDNYLLQKGLVSLYPYNRDVLSVVRSPCTRLGKRCLPGHTNRFSHGDSRSSWIPADSACNIDACDHFELRHQAELALTLTPLDVNDWLVLYARRRRFEMEEAKWMKMMAVLIICLMMKCERREKRRARWSKSSGRQALGMNRMRVCKLFPKSCYLEVVTYQTNGKYYHALETSSLSAFTSMIACYCTLADSTKVHIRLVNNTSFKPSETAKCRFMISLSYSKSKEMS